MPAKKDMTGVLFKNQKKDSDKHPDYKGSALVDGEEYWLAGWVNDNEKVGKYLSLKFEPKEESKSNKTPPRGGAPEEDRIPF
jgi:uncharacterized protein (DUF736 family)